MGIAGIAEIRPQETTDASLVEAVRDGDESAFGELYRRHQPEIGRFVLARVRDRGRAEDVTQEAFVSALRRLRQTEGEVAFRPWIFEIARNATIDSYRRTSRSEEVSIDAGGLVAADAGRIPSGLQPDVQAATREQLNYLRGALDELSETHHRVIVMRELEGRSYRDIGTRMNLSQSAVESTLFRARRRLEYEYAELDTGRRCRLVGAATSRLAEGAESARDRRRLERHARRCSSCRRRAREMGVEPVLRRGIAARAAALLPLPGLLRRRIEDLPAAVAGDAAGHSTAGLVAAPGFDTASGAAGKAVALVVTAVFVGGGGATLGGAGPMALEHEQPRPPAVERPAPTPASAERETGRSTRQDGGGDRTGARLEALPSRDRRGGGAAAPARREASEVEGGRAPQVGGSGPGHAPPEPAHPGLSSSAVEPAPVPEPPPPAPVAPAPPEPPVTVPLPPPDLPPVSQLVPDGPPVVVAPQVTPGPSLQVSVSIALDESL